MQGLNGLWRLYVGNNAFFFNRNALKNRNGIYANSLIKCAEPTYWLGSAQCLVWWRNQIIAPLSEEWTFRACMLPLLLQCFAPTTAIFICPLFFGVAHFHHLVENTRRGMDLKTALLRSCEFPFFNY